MSNLWFNIRFGVWHLTLSRDWEISFQVNSFQVEFRETDPNWKWFEIYCLFGKHL